MRKILSIVLLALFGLPLVSPVVAFAADRDAGTPACCRRAGKHHCSMSMGERSPLTQHDPAFSPTPEKCPYCPATLVATHTHVLAAPPAHVIFDSLLSNPAGLAQTESKRRISRDQSRQKRGPPVNLL